MGATTGMTPVGDYATPATPRAKAMALLNLIPNPDVGLAGSGAVAVGPHGTRNSYFDEMSPGAAAALRVELTALAAALPNA